MSEHSTETLYKDAQRFSPSEAFSSQANAKSSVYEEASDSTAWWASQTSRLTWSRAPQEGLDTSSAPSFKWFADGRLNVSVNCLDRHVASGLGERVAYHWEGEPGDSRTITYASLLSDVCRFANGLRSLGVGKGDRVAIYMGMVPELPVAMLACARIGAIHSVIFGGFSAQAIVDRVEDAEAKVLITSDGAWRRGKVVELKATCDEAMSRTSRIEHCVVLKRTEQDIAMTAGRDVWWSDLVKSQASECAPEQVEAEHTLFILYTSGTTGKPKGIMHSSAGYLLGATTTHERVFDIKPAQDIWWCAADIGWITGHSYIVYGPLANGATSVMYEGAPDFPECDRLWSIVAKHQVTQFYTAPTAIRAFMKWGEALPAKHDLSSIRVLGTVGEPINPAAWLWYREHIGPVETPIVDTWWQTETGSIMISPLPGVTTTKPGTATRPMPGIRADVVDEEGNSLPAGETGLLVVREPWPSMLRGIWGDPQRFVDTYFERFEGMYFTGDSAVRDEDGYFWLLGRVDDVMIVAGHNISTMEVESALVSHPAVVEAAVVGRKDDLTGQAIAAFVSLGSGREGDGVLIAELRTHVAKEIGPIAKPRSIVFTADLPKTRSGKIMRRLLRDISEQRQLGDVTTLANADIVAEIQAQASVSTEDG